MRRRQWHWSVSPLVSCFELLKFFLFTFQNYFISRWFFLWAFFTDFISFFFVGFFQGIRHPSSCKQFNYFIDYHSRKQQIEDNIVVRMQKYMIILIFQTTKLKQSQGYLSSKKSLKTLSYDVETEKKLKKQLSVVQKNILTFGFCVRIGDEFLLSYFY